MDTESGCDTLRDCESCDHNNIESGSMLKERFGI